MDRHIAPKLVEHDHEKHQDAIPQTHQPPEEEERGNYVQGIQLLLICISLCLCVFLVGLVSAHPRAYHPA